MMKRAAAKLTSSPISLSVKRRGRFGKGSSRYGKLSANSIAAQLYLSAAAVIAVLGGFYARLIFGSWCAAWCMAAVTALAYGAIYVILQLEDYALLAGSGLCVVLLAVVMGFTGKLNRRPQAE